MLLYLCITNKIKRFSFKSICVVLVAKRFIKTRLPYSFGLIIALRNNFAQLLIAISIYYVLNINPG